MRTCVSRDCKDNKRLRKTTAQNDCAKQQQTNKTEKTYSVRRAQNRVAFRIGSQVWDFHRHHVGIDVRRRVLDHAAVNPASNPLAVQLQNKRRDALFLAGPPRSMTRLRLLQLYEYVSWPRQLQEAFGTV